MTVETIISPKIKPSYILIFGSSSTDGETKDFSNWNYFTQRRAFQAGYYFSYDTSSLARDFSLTIKNETFCDIELIPEEMIEHDITIRMSPKRKYFIKTKITKIRKADPRAVIPENTYLDI